MENEKRSGIIRSIVIVTAGLLASLVLVFIFSRMVTNISATMTYNTALAVKKNMLYEYVNNMIIYLDGEREEYLASHPGATPEETEEYLTGAARKRIYEEKHADGAYMWIQKVLDYNGGDDYAIRLIHPNLSDTEGCYLSTNEVNQMGMKAYEIELEGIKADGEIYQNYAFKKLDSDEVTEKVTYAGLYKPYDWIICMGVNLDDIDHYRVQAQENMRAYQTYVITAIAFIWLTMLLLMLFIYRRTRIREFEKKNQELKNKLNWDALTGANSRIYGDRLLREEYQAFTEGRKDTMILMMDVDHFKQFNDGYGHELGDKVLKSFVKAIHDCIRSTDSVIRWGGDEFIVILRGVAPDIVPPIADKILNSIRAIDLEELPDGQRITSSMGFAYFAEGDPDYKAVLARADEALYKVKQSGRDNWKICDIISETSKVK